jgi:hypothetical protein
MNIKKLFVVGLISTVFASMVFANNSSVSVHRDPVLVDIASDDLYPTALPAAFFAGIVVGMAGNAAYDAAKWAAPYVYEWATKVYENSDPNSATSSVPNQYEVKMSENALD